MTQQDTQPPAETLAIEGAAQYVLENSRRGSASLNSEQFAADTEKLMDAYRDIIGKALASGHLAALTRRAGGDASCKAAPDHADIMETIQNAADDWQKKGYATALAEVRDMANVGRALMEALPEGYSYMDCPSEIVSDLQNERDEAVARAGGDAIPAGEGEPVAWRWERRGRFGPEIGAWEQVLTPYPPDKWPEDDRRNIVPLYATPKPPAGGDAGAVEDSINAVLERWDAHSGDVDERKRLIARLRASFSAEGK